MTREKLALFFAVLIPILWCAALVGGMLTGVYVPFLAMVPVILAEAGWLFGASIVVKRNDNGK